MLSHRPVQYADLEEVVRFPQSRRELFNIFPAALHPLTVEQLKKAVDSRFESTVVHDEDEVVGFANYYSFTRGECCAIGNVIVRPERRGKGIGRYLIKTMIEIAVSKYEVKTVYISCFSDNFTALLLYASLGFKPFEIEPVKDFDGNSIPRIRMRLDVKT